MPAQTTFPPQHQDRRGQLVSKGIRVNAVAPGPIRTPLIPASFSAERIAESGKDTPMGRAGQPSEVAPSPVFLASQDASYMTGQTLHPNGGQPVESWTRIREGPREGAPRLSLVRAARSSR